MKPDQGNAPPARPPLRQVAYSAFMKALSQGRIKPGQMVSQRELCDELEVPLGPLREAMKRLEAEHIVRLIPQRGVEIVDIDENVIEEIYQIRQLIELEGLRALARRMNPDEIADLLARTREASAEEARIGPTDLPRIRELSELDQEMHRLFVSALDNRFATEIYERALGKLRLVRFYKRTRRLSGPSAMQAHIGVLEALSEGRVDEACERLETHLRDSMRWTSGMN